LRSRPASNSRSGCWSITANDWFGCARPSRATCSGTCTTCGPSSPSRGPRCFRRSGARGSRGAWRAPSRPPASGSPATSLGHLRELSRTVDALEAEVAELVAQVAPQLPAEPGFGPLTAGKLIGEIAGAQRFATDAKLARAGGIAPIPVSTGNTNRHRLDRGGNRQINAAIHRVAITRARCHPETKTYLARKRAEGKTNREALRCLKRHLAHRIWHLLQPPPANALSIDLLT
jgi:transposase